MHGNKLGMLVFALNKHLANPAFDSFTRGQDGQVAGPQLDHEVLTTVQDKWGKPVADLLLAKKQEAIVARHHCPDVEDRQGREASVADGRR